MVRHIEADDPRAALFQLPVIEDGDLPFHDDLIHILLQVLHGQGLAGEGLAEDHIRLRGPGHPGSPPRCARLDDGLGLLGHRLLAQCGGGVKQGLALQLLVGVDLDLDLAAKPVGDKLPDRRDAGLEIGNTVGDEADVQRLALEMPSCPGQRTGGQGVMLDKNSAQVKKNHL